MLARTRGDDGYACPGATGAASYVGRLAFLALALALALAVLLDGGGVESVSFEPVILDATVSSSSVSEELGARCEKRLAGGTMTDESPVVDDSGMRTELCKECRPEEELVSGTGTLYRARGSILGLATAPFVGADGVE